LGTIAQRAGGPAELIIRDADGKSAFVPLDIDRFSLGRSSVNQLCYPEDAGLSRHHLTLFRSGGEWMVQDLGSKNGTLLNGVRIEGARPFRPGDRISAGHLTIEFGAGQAAPVQQTVVFVEGAAEPAPNVATTVVQNLQGVLGPADSGELSRTHVMQGSPQMRALIRAGRELAGHRPLEDLFQVILDLSVEAVMAGRGILMTLEKEELVVRAARGDGFRISQAVRERVIRDKESLLVRDAQLDEALKSQKSIVEQRVRSMIAVPLQTTEQVIGLIYVDSPHLIREFTREDLNLLTVMANVAAIRIEHARLIEVEQQDRILKKDLHQAAELQRGLLPKRAPLVAGTDLAGFNIASRAVGGDYFDFFAYPDGRVALICADVAGKGMPAALLMSSLQARVQVLLEEPDNLSDKIVRLNKAICANTPDNRFITFFLAVLNPATGGLSYVNAGHNPALVLRADGSEEWLSDGGPVLGILPIARYREAAATLRPGDTLVMYSDGVTEAAAAGSDEEFGEQRVADTVKAAAGSSAEEIVRAVSAAVNQFTKGAPLADDLTVVVAKLLETGSPAAPPPPVVAS
jgi:serine phosphatase RsbU (regulator of sigma subunit)